jgi:hypothetical protein
LNDYFFTFPNPLQKTGEKIDKKLWRISKMFKFDQEITFERLTVDRLTKKEESQVKAGDGGSSGPGTGGTDILKPERLC